MKEFFKMLILEIKTCWCLMRQSYYMINCAKYKYYEKKLNKYARMINEIRDEYSKLGEEET